MSDCVDWTTWRKALGVKSAGGGYTVEYIFYTVFSVTIPFASTTGGILTLSLGFFCCLCQFFGQELRDFCEAQWNSRD